MLYNVDMTKGKKTTKNKADKTDWRDFAVDASTNSAKKSVEEFQPSKKIKVKKGGNREKPSEIEFRIKVGTILNLVLLGVFLLSIAMAVVSYRYIMGMMSFWFITLLVAGCLTIANLIVSIITSYRAKQLGYKMAGKQKFGLFFTIIQGGLSLFIVLIFAYSLIVPGAVSNVTVTFGDWVLLIFMILIVVLGVFGIDKIMRMVHGRRQKKSS